MSEVYILTLHTVYYDFDTHFYEYALGVYSTEEKAEEAYEKFIEEHLDENERLDVPDADDWRFTIDTYIVDGEPFAGCDTSTPYGKSSKDEEVD